MTKLSVNINKIATIRNARGGDLPNVLLAAQKCEQFGADGITVHPRPDARHITYEDVRQISPIITTEFNIEGYPSPSFIELIKEVKPHQVTLVPDPPDVLTSNAGWNTIQHRSFLSSVINEFKMIGVRTSIFVDTDLAFIEGAKHIGSDRVELYTEQYASNFTSNKMLAVEPYVRAASHAQELQLGVNAGHDLNLDNLPYFASSISCLDEVSIGHALISDALYLGLETTIKKYKHCLS
ncbi:MAG: pyridoxine 5'-phosphate synthase [Bacteroidota bacterium]|nr:pyridoxine 5'-phosphate synthase [Bacteroidota bacterium]